MAAHPAVGEAVLLLQWGRAPPTRFPVNLHQAAASSSDFAAASSLDFSAAAGIRSPVLWFAVLCHSLVCYSLLLPDLAADVIVSAGSCGIWRSTIRLDLSLGQLRLEPERGSSASIGHSVYQFVNNYVNHTSSQRRLPLRNHTSTHTSWSIHGKKKKKSAKREMEVWSCFVVPNAFTRWSRAEVKWSLEMKWSLGGVKPSQTGPDYAYVLLRLQAGLGSGLRIKKIRDWALDSVLRLLQARPEKCPGIDVTIRKPSQSFAGDSAKSTVSYV